jgi:GT2 family glycosyltransferase
VAADPLAFDAVLTDHRPAVSVVVPFHGDPESARALLETLASLEVGPGDEIVVADNTPDEVLASLAPARVRVTPAHREQSPACARNTASAMASGEWLLYFDADCRPRPDLIARYFDPAPDPECGALAGEVETATPRTVVGRYADIRGALHQRGHLDDPYMPKAVTANLLVRRSVWEDLGGFAEGARTAEDTDFCFRMQQIGWRIGYRAAATVRHEHREALRPLLRQRLAYGAGAAWLQRRHPGSVPPPRVAGILARWLPGFVYFLATRRLERAAFKLIDLPVLACDVGGRAGENRPRGSARPERPSGPVALLETCGERGGPSLASGGAVRLEARHRPVRGDREELARHRVDWGEDDGALHRLRALAWLLARRPSAVRSDLGRRPREGSRLLELAPLARRATDPPAPLIAHDGARADDARRVAALVGSGCATTPLERTTRG